MGSCGSLNKKRCTNVQEPFPAVLANTDGGGRCWNLRCAVWFTKGCAIEPLICYLNVVPARLWELLTFVPSGQCHCYMSSWGWGWEVSWSFSQSVLWQCPLRKCVPAGWCGPGTAVLGQCPAPAAQLCSMQGLTLNREKQTNLGVIFSPFLHCCPFALGMGLAFLHSVGQSYHLPLQFLACLSYNMLISHLLGQSMPSCRK